MNKKKPVGIEWDNFVQNWYGADHAGKVALAQLCSTSYETAKHWISESGSTQKKPTMKVTAEELLSMNPAVNLDFVFFDLETSGFDADWDILLTACVKPYGRDVITFRADRYSTWEKEKANDKQMTVDIANELRKHAIVVGHYSEKFDVPFLRAKMLRHGVEPLPPMFGIDTWRIALKSFKVSSRRMKSLSIFAQIKLPKEEPEGDRWMKAAFNADPDAMDKILAHNIDDVLILEKLACLSFPYLKSIPRL